MNPSPDALAAGVAVLADNTWAALQGRDQLKVELERRALGQGIQRCAGRLAPTPCSTATTPAWLCATTATSPRRASRRGASSRRATRCRSSPTRQWSRPAALIDIRPDGARLIAAVQDPDGASRTIADMTGLARGDIRILLPRGGGSFGRRLDNDYVVEAVLVAQAAGKPVKLMWTREDDLGHDFYRPFGVHALAATLDRRKRLTGWSHRCAATPRNYRNATLKNQPPHAGCMDANSFPAGSIANLDQTFFSVTSGMPRDARDASLDGFQAFAVQCFIDEIAIATQQDAVKLRLDLLGETQAPVPADGGALAFDSNRLANVLTRCAEKIGWGVRRSDGHGLGIACHHAAGGYVAHAFELAIEGNDLRIHRAVCIADVGRLINPPGVEANLVAGTIDAVSSALHLAITLKHGQVQQKNFPDYPLLRMAQAPRTVEVEIVPSDAEPFAVAQMGLPSAAPALANAIYAATTVRVRKLPLMPELMRRL